MSSLHSSPHKIENLHSPIYFGDSNVTAGKSFYVQCITDSQVEWFKDDEPVKMHLIRHSKDDYNYKQIDEKSINSSRIKSTLSVNHALSRHSGNYRCNVKHRNFHRLEVTGDRKVELGSLYDLDYDDHNEIRETAFQSTMMVFVEQVTEKTNPFSIDKEIEQKPQEEITKISDKMYELEDDEENVVKIELNGNHKSHEKLEIVTEISATSMTDITSTLKSTTLETVTTTKQSKHHHHHHHQAKLEPTDPIDKDRKLFTIGKLLTLGCKAGDDTEKITWMKNNEKITSNDHRKIIKDEGKLIIAKANADDAGNYTCNLNSESLKFEVWANVYVSIPKHIYVVENEKLEIECKVHGSNPEITWFYSNTSTEDSAQRIELSDDERIKLLTANNIAGSKLVIEHAEMSDRGYYYCAGTNDYMDEFKVPAFEYEGFVRVKDKLAALWPFLGICAEVFILCTIILIYEKRRNKTDLDESDTDQSPDQKSDQKR